MRQFVLEKKMATHKDAGAITSSTSRQGKKAVVVSLAGHGQAVLHAAAFVLLRPAANMLITAIPDTVEMILQEIANSIEDGMCPRHR